MTANISLPLVDSTGRATPYFLKLLQQLNVNITDAMPTPPAITINADYTGTILTNALPAICTLTRTNNGNDISLQCQWSMHVESGMITASISSGIVTITALSSSSAVLLVKSTRNHVDLYATVTVNKVNGPTPNAGSPGGAATCTTFNAISSTSYGSPITTGTLSVTVGASGTVNLSAPLDVSVTNALPTGTFTTYGKWQWYNGSSWVDVATEIASSPSPSVSGNRISGYTENDGTLTVNMSKTGLTNGSTAQFQLLARCGSTARGTYFVGTASAVPQ